MHRHKTEEGTLQALRKVKDYLVQNGGSKNFEVTTGLLDAKILMLKSETYLTEKRKMKHRGMETEAVRKGELQRKNKLAEVERDIVVL